MLDAKRTGHAAAEAKLGKRPLPRGVLAGAELLAQATPQHWKAEKLERRKEAEEIVFRDYKKRVVDDPLQLAQADSGSGGSGDARGTTSSTG